MPGDYYNELFPWTWTKESNPYALTTHLYPTEDTTKDREIATLQGQIRILEEELGRP